MGSEPPLLNDHVCLCPRVDLLTQVKQYFELYLLVLYIPWTYFPRNIDIDILYKDY